MILPSDPGPDPILSRFRRIRARTESLVCSLDPEDCMVQTMADVSPTKWHLAHTSWFFEQFVLLPWARRYPAFSDHFGYLFNSYYETVGERQERAGRGLLSRPRLGEVMRYRAHVDAAMEDLLEAERDPERLGVVELGLNHEEQHQELIVTDIKHVLGSQPLEPALFPAHALVAPEPDSGIAPPAAAVIRGTSGPTRGVAAEARAAVGGGVTSDARASGSGALEWVALCGDVHTIGHDGPGFAFDNERPAHRVLLDDFALASRPVTNGEFLEFVADGGYRRPELWLADGWTTVRERGWNAPLYWRASDSGWTVYTLSGRLPLDPREPVCHVSYYEADAYARWAGARLPLETEWEVAAATVGCDAPASASRFHPRPGSGGGLARSFGDVWEWTASSYEPYPGFRPVAGALGEYNGKFMCNQRVLRGASCATAPGHARRTYRNFFFPDARWQFSGIRLASA